jgi:hypothetical protein
MCPANGELENGDPESPVDFLCRVAHLRAHAFGLAVPPHGDCEYCPGGSGYAALMTSAAGLRPVWPTAAELPAARLLPVLKTEPSGNACATGGCSSCRGHAL